jgi:hypothetical protein
MAVETLQYAYALLEERAREMGKTPLGAPDESEADSGVHPPPFLPQAEPVQILGSECP